MSIAAEEWKAEGIQIGQAIGKAEGKADMLLRQLRRRFDPHPCSRNRLEKVFISSCARKRDIEFRRCSWRSAVGVVGTRTVMPGVSNELGGQRVRGCLVWR
jgi:hypothetical protein